MVAAVPWWLLYRSGCCAVVAAVPWWLLCRGGCCAEIPEESQPQNIDNVCEDDGHCIILGLAKLLQWSVPQYQQRIEGMSKFLEVEEIRAVVNRKSQLEIKRLNLETLEMVLRAFSTPDRFPKHLRLDWGKVLFNVRLCDGNIQHYFAVDFDRREAVDAAHKGAQGAHCIHQHDRGDAGSQH